MTQATAPDARTETFLITIQKKAGTYFQFPAVVTTYDITGGDKDFTQIANGKGGRIKKFEFQTPYEITLEAYSIEAGTYVADSGTTSTTTSDKLVESGQNFETTITVGMVVHNTTDGTFANVTAIDSNTTLALDSDIMTSGETYTIAVADGKGFADLMATVEVSQPISISANHVRNQYLLAIAHTTNTSVTNALAESSDGDRIERDIFKNGHFVSYVSSMTDGIRKHTIKYKVNAFAKDGSSNITQDSSDGSSGDVVPEITYT